MRGICALVLLATSCLVSGCTYGSRHDIQWNSYSQVWLSEASQVRIRNAQSRVFDSKDKLGMLQAIVATFQDLGFQIEVLDETLGIVSGKKFVGLERPSGSDLPTYLLYDEESLVVFQKSYRSWGPFERRSDLVRLTVTVRDRNASQMIVRASAQYYLRPVEAGETYLAFYAALEQALFAERAARDPS